MNDMQVMPKSSSVELAAVSETAAIMAMIERVASNPAVDIDRLERLMEMAEKASARQAKTAYFAALAELQNELPVIERKGRIVVQDKEDRRLRVDKPRVIQSTPYALWEDINEAIKPQMAKHGFAISFRVGNASDGRLIVTGILSHRDGHSEETTMTLPYDSTGSKNTVQAIGSSTSYGKRYVASALLNLTSRAPEDQDDDGGAAIQRDTITEDQEIELRDMLLAAGRNEKRFCAHIKVDRLADIAASKFEDAKRTIQAAIEKVSA